VRDSHKPKGFQVSKKRVSSYGVQLAKIVKCWMKERCCVDRVWWEQGNGRLGSSRWKSEIEQVKTQKRLWPTYRCAFCRG